MAHATLWLRMESTYVLARVESYFAMRGWSDITTDPSLGFTRAKTSTTLRSWGEEVNVRVVREGEGSLVLVESHPAGQLLDWGKSAENVNGLINFLQSEARLESIANHVPHPETA